MDKDQNLSSDFSGVPALGDEEGLNTYLENENLKALGIDPQASQPSPAGQEPSVQGQPAPSAPAADNQIPANNPVTQDQIAAIMAQLQAVNAQLAQAKAAPQPQSVQNAYTPQQRQFINEALNRGYSMEQILATLKQRSAQAVQQDALVNRMNNLERYLQNQEYQAAQDAFISKVSSFGEKWGLSEQDLVTFGNAALKQGINIAQPNIDLETVFRAVYPQQYAIRAQRMQPTSTSQIFGGTSAGEPSRSAASRQEDAYVEDFLRKAMPNYGKPQQ